MDRDKLQRAFIAMLDCKSFRVTKEFRENVRGVSDQWWVITSIDSEGNITICGNNHTIFEGEDVNILVNL